MCDNAAEGVSTGSNWRDALQHSRFGHIFPISVSNATWLMVPATRVFLRRGPKVEAGVSGRDRRHLRLDADYVHDA
jgi:hypothetical protein